MSIEDKIQGGIFSSCGWMVLIQKWLEVQLKDRNFFKSVLKISIEFSNTIF